MEKNVVKRLLAGVLVACLMFGNLMPLTAHATEVDEIISNEIITDEIVDEEPVAEEPVAEEPVEEPVAEDPVQVIAEGEELYVDSYTVFVEELKVLETYAANYAATSGKNAGELILNFLRTGVERYNDSNWTTLAGEEVIGFTTYVAEQDALKQTTAMRLRNIEQFTLPNGQEVDFGHMFGMMNIAYIASVMSADLGGWAGDICDLMAYSKNFGNVPAGTIEEMAAYIRTNCFGVDADQAFGMDDFYGDMDGLYLTAQMKVGKVLSAAMEVYFTDSLSNENRAEYFLKNRFNNLYTKESVREAVYNAYTSNVGLGVLEAGRGLSGETDLRTACCYAFADYVYDLAGHTLEEPEIEEPGEKPEVENPYYTVFSDISSVLAPGITQTIKYAQTADNKQIVYYLANVDVTRDDVTIMAGYNDADPGKGWAMQRVLDQANAMNAKHSNPDDEENYIENFRAIVATNGAGFNMSTGEPSGLLVMDGKEWHPVNADGFFAILKDGSAKIGTTAEYATYKDQIQEAISGFGSVLVKDGELVAKNDGGRASRTAIGIKADGSVVMMVMDGRQAPFSVGGTMAEIAQVMLDAGCVHAINLDGGGSTTFVAKPEGSNDLAVISRPSDGYQRSVSTSLIAISTAKGSDELDHANISSEYDYLTIGTQLQMTATGVNNIGGAVAIPEDAQWQVSDESIGSVTADGVFTALANGEVEVQLVSGGEVVGNKKLNVVVPDAIAFEQSSMNIIFGVPAKMPVVTYYNGNPVAFNENDVILFPDDAYAGDSEGLYFTASEVYGIRTVQIYALLLPDAELFDEITLSVYKADEAFFDFGDVTSGNRTLAWVRDVENATTKDDIIYQIATPGEDMTVDYTFAMDMTAIEIPPHLQDLTYMLPGADEGKTAWEFLLSLAERVSELTEVKITVQMDPNLDVDISELKISNDLFVLRDAKVNENNLLTITAGWVDQTQAIDAASANPICILSGLKATPKDDASWDTNGQLIIRNTGNVSYKIFLRASSLHSFACDAANQAKYGLQPYSGDKEEFYLNGNPLTYEDGYEKGAYLSNTYADFEDTFILDGALLQGWIENSGKLYYYADGIMLQNTAAELPGQEDPAAKYFYAFDADGVCIGKTSGLVEVNGDLYYTRNGVAQTKWQTIMDNTGKVNYYFFHTTTHKAVDGKISIGGYNYEFKDHILVRGEVVANVSGTRYMWAGEWASQEWLNIDGKIAYARSNGYFDNEFHYRYSPEGIWTYYAFGEDGWLLTDVNGIYDRDGYTYLIRNGIITEYPGLFELDGEYYYIASTNVMVKDRYYWVSKSNGILPEGRYLFDADGKLVLNEEKPETPNPEEPKPDVPETPEEPKPVKNGFVSEEGTIYYYVNGVRTYAGVLYIDGYYYYVRTTGEVINGRNYWITKTNGLLPEKSYTFDAEGRITNPPIVEPEKPDTPDTPDTPVVPDKKNGIVAEDGKLFFYEDGVRTYAGLIYQDGYYYYVRTSGQLAQNTKYWPTKTNGLLNVKRQYTFDELGRMTDCDFGESQNPGTPDQPDAPKPEVKNGIVEEDGSLFYYVNGKRDYAGLICIDGNWYYVRTNGELAHNIDYWPTKTNGYMKTTKRYYFDSNGIMQDPPAELLNAAN